MFTARILGGRPPHGAEKLSLARTIFRCGSTINTAKAIHATEEEKDKARIAWDDNCSFTQETREGRLFYHFTRQNLFSHQEEDGFAKWCSSLPF